MQTDIRRISFTERSPQDLYWDLERVLGFLSLARPGRKQVTATSSGFIQHTPHEAQSTS